MTIFDIIQQQIWGNSIIQASLQKLCIRGCNWLNDEGICVSSTGCMYQQSKEVCND